MTTHRKAPAVEPATEPLPGTAHTPVTGPEPAPDNALVVQPGSAGPPAEPQLDAHGHDPAGYQWVPVLRKPRKDGWTPQRQRDFIAVLADTGLVTEAAAAVGMSEQSCYRLRRAPGAEKFAAAWDVATQHGARKLVDVAFDRAFKGTEEPVFDRDGNRVGRRFRQNDRLLMFLLRAYMPERFRHAHRDVRGPGEAPPLPAEPLGPALEQLLPVPPEQPHLLMPPEELEDALECADLLDGELPHWHRGQGDAEPPTDAPALGGEFEAELEAAKRPPSRGEGPGEDPFLD